VENSGHECVYVANRASLVRAREYQQQKHRLKTHVKNNHTTSKLPPETTTTAARRWKALL